MIVSLTCTLQRRTASAGSPHHMLRFHTFLIRAKDVCRESETRKFQKKVELYRVSFRTVELEVFQSSNQSHVT